MADSAETQSDEKKPRRMVSLVLWVFVACASIGGGFATPFLVDHFRSSDQDGSLSSSMDPSEPPSLIEFGEVTVNLNESRLNRYLRVNISLLVNQSEEVEITKILEEKKPHIRSWLLSHMAGKGMEDIRGTTGQNRLRREILTHFNSVLFPGSPPRIRDVLFKDFNVQ